MKNKKYLYYIAFIGSILLYSFVTSFADRKLRTVFCNVGQGDAIYVRTPSHQDMLIDGGPNDRVLSCLGKYMPFYDRTIDVMVLTHPQKDHMNGLLQVLERYDVEYVVIPKVMNETQGYRDFLRKIKEKGTQRKTLSRGERVEFGETGVTVLWPEKQWETDHLRTSEEEKRENDDVLGVATSADLNDFSYYLLLQYGTFSELLTGDGDVRIQDNIMQEGKVERVNVLKYPHHGSKTGSSEEFLKRLDPDLAVISVGKNSYGHPHPSTLEMLMQQEIEIRRTDQNGDIKVVSDGKKWWVEE